MAKDKKLWIDGVLGSELKDTQGETLSVEGADISDLEAGKGRWNDNHGKGFFNSLGTITEAKKIFKAEDCENERHTYYWEKIKAPYIYGKGFLFNDEDHPNAKAAAAIMRNIHREDSPLKIKASVEGGVLSRGIKDPTRLARTKIHSCAITFTPANTATLLEPLNLDKSNIDWESDKQLIKSVMHLAETNVPSFRHIERHASANTIYENINKIKELAKTVGIEITVKDLDPNQIMEKAALSKVTNNISKINELVKAIGGSSIRAAADEARTGNKAAKDNFQQNIGKLKHDSSVPKKIIDTSNNMRAKSATSVKHTNTLKSHALKAIKDPSHLNTVHESLTSNGTHPDKVKLIISKIKSHMTSDMNKSLDLEKGDATKAVKNLVLAGAMAAGINSMSPKKDVKPEQKISREQKVKDHNSNIKNPEYHVDGNKGGKKDTEIHTAERSPASKEVDTAKYKKYKGKDADYYNAADARLKARAEKVKAKYSKMKKGLSKALTAGYGGAGAPTDLSGGGVFQVEALSEGKRAKKAESQDEFDYVTCDNCGHEQVYMKHQVKCRKCRQNFSLNKLEGLV